MKEKRSATKPDHRGNVDVARDQRECPDPHQGQNWRVRRRRHESEISADRLLQEPQAEEQPGEQEARDNRALSANVIQVVDAQGRQVDSGPMMRFGGGSAEPVKLALAPGTYRVTLSAMGYATQTVNVVSPSSPTILMSPGGTVVMVSGIVLVGVGVGFRLWAILTMVTRIPTAPINPITAPINMARFQFNPLCFGLSC